MRLHGRRRVRHRRAWSRGEPLARKSPGSSGEQVYRTRCASCHDQASPRIPPREALQKMSALRILRALDFGAMMTVAYPLSRDERQAVATYLGLAGSPAAPPPSAFCGDRSVKLVDPPKWPGTGGARARQTLVFSPLTRLA